MFPLKMNHDLILIRYGELALKSAFVRRQFESALTRNIKQVFQTQNIPYTLQKQWGRIYLHTKEIDKSIPLLTKIFGITSVSPAVQTTADIQEISCQAILIAKEHIKKNNIFALRVTRTGNHCFTSQDIAIKIGDDIRKATKARVDLTHPDVELFIEIRDNKAFFFLEKIRGPGGLPLGTQGNVVALIDTKESLLASWYLMRRGCTVTFVSLDESLTDSINSFLNTWQVNFPIIVVSDKKNLTSTLQNIIVERNADALVTGHTLFSATALAEITHFKNQLNYPVLSPLCVMDKKEIRQKCTSLGISL